MFVNKPTSLNQNFPKQIIAIAQRILHKKKQKQNENS